MRNHDLDELLPADKLQAVARRLVDKAAAGDLSAIRKVLDRIAGNTATAVNERNDNTNYVSVRLFAATSAMLTYCRARA